MIKDTNERIRITLSKQQVKWLRTNAKKLGMSLSKFVKFLIDKNIAKIANQMTQEELEYIIKIARTPWIKFYDEDEE